MTEGTREHEGLTDPSKREQTEKSANLIARIKLISIYNLMGGLDLVRTSVMTEETRIKGDLRQLGISPLLMLILNLIV